jgi:murein DD-endopeptidase MepM/ murein hydrolase activator NlpD
MDTDDRTVTPPLPSPPRLWLRPLLRAALGGLVALVLAGTGFGLGSFYARQSAPAAAAAQVETRVSATTPAATGGVGGPEEPAPLTSAPLMRQAAPVPGRNKWRAPEMYRPVAGGWMSSDFGRRMDPFTGEPAQHWGLDFAGLQNSAILAVAPGVVTWSGRQRGYGNLIEIDHGQGWVTRYGHNAFNLVAPGDYVKPGQTIALMGSTGRATGTHLHFEVLFRGRRQNPVRFLPRAT